MTASDRVVIIAGAVIAFLLQVLLAPHITIFFAFPNFIVAYCLAVAVARPNTIGSIMPFVMGLVYDLVSGGPVGAMAFSLTLISATTAAHFRRSNNDTVFMGVAVLLGGVFLVELVYGILFLLFGYAASIPDAFVYRILPCFLYDFVISLVIYLVLTRFIGQAGSAPTRSEITQL